MKLTKIFIILAISLLSCVNNETEFSEAALNDTFIALNGENITFKSILEKHKGNKVVVDVWASWCKDCIKGMPRVKALQTEFPKAHYVFLSLDRNIQSWKKGIDKYQVKGDHYFMKSGWKGDFGNFLGLNWIPRYLVINKDGSIQVFNAIKADDKDILNALKN